MKLARQLGSTHGKEVDKFEVFNISTKKLGKAKSPFITGSYASISCKVITSFSAGAYTVYLAEALNVEVDGKQKPILWHQDKYFTLGSALK